MASNTSDNSSTTSNEESLSKPVPLRRTPHQPTTPALRFMFAKKAQLQELDQTAYRMVQLRHHMSLFSCFDEEDTASITGQIQTLKDSATLILEDVRLTVSETAVQWLTMHRTLMKREYALNEAQSNGIFDQRDPCFRVLLQKQAELTQLVTKLDNKIR